MKVFRVARNAQSILAVVAVFALAACSDDTEGDDDDVAGPVFGTDEDLQMAADLWAAMDGYQSWDNYPGVEGIVAGGSPHGAFIQYFLDGTAAADTETFAAGSIIVKDNYREDDASTLDAVTVMEKVAGYNADEADWFWVKFAPDGTVMTNPAGVALAGRVGKGGDAGCIKCQNSAEGGDFVFVND